MRLDERQEEDMTALTDYITNSWEYKDYEGLEWSHQYNYAPGPRETTERASIY